MIKEIVHDQILLSQVAEPATAEDAAVAQDLVDTIKSLDDCACLAANQIGVNKAIVAYEQKGHVFVLFNPKVLAGMKPFRAQEGCLSLESVSSVKRFQTVRVSFQELVGEQLVPRTRTFQDFTAQCVQHGIDHCAGKLV
ncbi:peptide deformylase [Collinsella sp. D33t1_170424_A12]|uniref:peptide deformylase n=1 Tax=Collinsella sp. D33t1_170424_A12 TaxID=2787135 RepID=UPI0018992DDF|nr:peptide deformylase [Collinsella sp. D33t1_170424_A12]